MSEFKLSADRYISEWNGSSLNPGTNVSPFSHPADADDNTALRAIIGTGFYSGSFTKKIKLQGDGLVEIDMINNNLPPSITVSTSTANPLYQNIHFKRVNGFPGINNIVNYFLNCRFSCKLFNTAAANLPDLRFENCIIEPNDVSSIGNSVGNKQPVFYGSMILANTADSLLRNTAPARAVNLCYIPKETSHTLDTPTSTAAPNSFVNSMINGILIIGGISYEAKLLWDGSPRPDADPLLADIATAPFFSAFYTNGNYAGDPKFVDIYKKIVSPDSDLLRRNGSYGYVGGVRPGKKITVNSSDPDVTITSTDIDTTTDPTNWLIQSPATEGFIYITWKVSDNIAEIQRFFLDALLSFDGSEAGGSVGNNNVPDNFPESYSPTSNPGMTPNRLTYELRTSQSIAKPTTEAQWDNDNVTLGTTPGAYYVQEWNTKPTIVTVLGVRYGNGNPESIGGAANGINARWAQAKIRLTNNREI